MPLDAPVSMTLTIRSQQSIIATNRVDGRPARRSAECRTSRSARVRRPPAENRHRISSSDRPECTARTAVNAVMAGCKPEFFPVIVAAFEAMNEPDFNFHGSTASTGGSAPLLVVSGPMADELGMNSDVNLFGPGNRANATIGRAVRLILMNVFRMIPGVSDKSTQGNPGKYSLCIAERSRGNPWPLLVEEQDFPDGVSSVTVFAGGGFPMWRTTAPTHQNKYSQRCRCHGELWPYTPASSLSSCRRNMRIISGAGWSRAQVKEYFTQAYRTVDGLKSVGKFRQREYDKQHADGGTSCSSSPTAHVVSHLDDILLVVGGGDGRSLGLSHHGAGTRFPDAIETHRRLYRLRLREKRDATLRSDRHRPRA